MTRHILLAKHALKNMNSILSASLILISTHLFGQQWPEYRVDSTLTVRIPENIVVLDTLGQHILRAQIDNALIMIQRLPNTGEQAASIQSKNDLIDNYKGFQRGLVESQKGKLKNQKIFQKDGLELIHFSYYATRGEEQQLRHCLTVFINGAWYSVHFWELATMTDELAEEREQLFSSVTFPPGVNLKNQMSASIEGSRMYNRGFLIGKTLGYILMLVLAVVSAIWISRAVNRKTRHPKQI